MIDINHSQNPTPFRRVGRRHATAQPNHGGRPGLASLLRLLGVVLLLLPAFAARAEVSFTTLHFFTNFPNGANSYAQLAQGSDGYFYGTTSTGGTSNFGTVFKIDAQRGIDHTVFLYRQPVMAESPKPD